MIFIASVVLEYTTARTVMLRIPIMQPEKLEMPSKTKLVALDGPGR